MLPQLAFERGDAVLRAARRARRARVHALPPDADAPRGSPSGSPASRSRTSAARPSTFDLDDPAQVRALVDDFVLPGFTSRRLARISEGSIAMTTNMELIGRDEINDLEAILSITNTDVDAVVHAVGAELRRDLHVGLRAQPPAARQALREGEDVAVERHDRPRLVDRRRPGEGRARRARPDGGPFVPGARPSRARRSSTSARRSGARSAIEIAELAALAVHARRAGRAALHRAHRRDRAVDRRQVLRGDAGDGRGPPRRGVRQVPRREARRATTRSTRTSRLLLDDILADTRWDMTYLGMQIMVEGLALAAFGFMHQMTTEPLLKKLLRYVMSDEARHVAFGVLSLQEYYKELTDAEMRERQEFAFEAAVRMRDRFLQQEVWERMGVDVKDAVAARAWPTTGRADVPEDAVLEDRAELQEARPARRARRLAARALHRARRDPVRGLGRHRRGVRRARRGRQGPRRRGAAAY